MPADTMREMILGFGTILGVLLVYILTLIVRTYKAKTQYKKKIEE